MLHVERHSLMCQVEVIKGPGNSRTKCPQKEASSQEVDLYAFSEDFFQSVIYSDKRRSKKNDYLKVTIALQEVLSTWVPLLCIHTMHMRSLV